MKSVYANAAHESDHFYKMVLVQIQFKPTFDFTVGGAFDPFNNYTQFLALSKHLKILAYALTKDKLLI
jgi:hypothetical protein